MKKRGRPGKKILCINDGLVYNSMCEAATSYHTTQSAISKQLSGQRKSVRGYYFKEICGTESLEEITELIKSETDIILKRK